MSAILSFQEFKMLVKKHWDWKDHEGRDYDRIRDHDEAQRTRIAELEAEIVYLRDTQIRR